MYYASPEIKQQVVVMTAAQAVSQLPSNLEPLPKYGNAVDTCFPICIIPAADLKLRNVGTHSAPSIAYTHYASALRITEFSNAIEIHCMISFNTVKAS